MSLELLLPVEEIAVAHTALQSDLTLGRKIKIHTKKNNEENLDSIHKMKGKFTSLDLKSFTHQVICIEN